jgi:hypothetical protein
MPACIWEDRAGRRPTGGKTAAEPRVGKSAARSACWRCLLFCPLMLALGCGGSGRSVEHVEVKGRVLHKGEPLPGGRVTFVATDRGFAISADIDEQGNYTIKAPVGAVIISVDNRMLSRQGVAAAKNLPKGAGRPPSEGGGKDMLKEAPPVKGTYKQIPSKYYLPETSGLTYTVQKGSQTHDIELTD